MSKKSFLSDIFFYTSLESILYQAILCSHQILLFRVINTDLYGEIGAFFSLLFLLIPYLNLGLDGSFASVFNAASMHKKAFKNLVAKQLLSVIIVPPIIAALYFFSKACAHFPLKLINAFSMQMFILLGALIIVESLKKNIKTFLTLSLCQRRVALTEIATLIGYVILVWVRLAYEYYKSGTLHSLDPSDFLVPLGCMSFCALIVYAVSLYKIYEKLPNSDEYYVDLSIAMLRTKNWVYQILHGLYSSNFIIISCANLYGFEFAALLKTISFCMYGINYIVQHVFGTTISIAVARIQGSSTQERDILVKIVQRYLHRAVSAFFILLASYFMYMGLTNQHKIYYDFLHPAALFVVLLFCENFVIVRENYYLAQGKIESIIMGNIIIFIPYFRATYLNQISTSPLILLYTILLARIMYIIFLYKGEYIKNCAMSLFQKISVAFSPEIG